MSASITFDAEKLIKKLNLIEKAYLPQAAEQALRSFGFESRKTLADAMREKYQNPTNYTLSSPRYKVDGHTLTISVLDDPRQNQSAAEYLQPTDRSGGVRRKEIKPTTLAGVMRRFGAHRNAARRTLGSVVPLPQAQALGVVLETASHGASRNLGTARFQTDGASGHLPCHTTYFFSLAAYARPFRSLATTTMLMVGTEPRHPAGSAATSTLFIVSSAGPMRTSTLWPCGDLAKKGAEYSLRKGSISHETIFPSAGSTSAIVRAP